ncbi:MAG TPA: cupin domain-containing protein [Gemmatimonadales bacterium]|nr:cupin domain-containing protein [Gemmatimonadales bacterium]
MNAIPWRHDVDAVLEEARSQRRFGERYGAQWTPTILVLDAEGVERHRIEGFLPLEDFLAQVTLGLGHLALQAGRWKEAAARFRDLVDHFPKTEAAPEALYWAGVARSKEVHHDRDQFFRVETGAGEVWIDGVRAEIESETAILVPAGARHKIRNTAKKPLKLYTLYAPPEHADKTVHKTKADSSSEP